MSNDAMIAFLPVDGSWCKQAFPHMTLVWGDSIDNLQPTDFNALAKDALSAGRITGTFNLTVTGVEELGEGIDAVDALILYPTPQLLLARNLVEHWTKSEFKDFKPHATIGPVGSAAAIVDNPPIYSSEYRRQALPTRLYFNRIAACWGDKKMVFNIDDMMY
jgi:hypothetical protein